MIESVTARKRSVQRPVWISVSRIGLAPSSLFVKSPADERERYERDDDEGCFFERRLCHCRVWSYLGVSESVGARVAARQVGINNFGNGFGRIERIGTVTAFGVTYEEELSSVNRLSPQKRGEQP